MGTRVAGFAGSECRVDEGEMAGADLACSTVLQYDLDTEEGEEEPRPLFVHS